MSGRDLNFQQASESFRRLNAGLLGGVGLPKTPDAPVVTKVDPKQKAVRQKAGDGMNKTERAAFEHLISIYERKGGGYAIEPHGLTMLLSNGVRYTPDVIVQAGGRILAYEVKAMRGRRVHVEDDASVKVKMAARVWRTVTFTMMWRDKQTGVWEMQEILP